MHVSHVVIAGDRFPTDAYYPFNLDVLRRTPAVELAPVTLMVGDNGAGKSTLLEAIARRCGIHIWEGNPVHRVDRNPYEKRLHEYIDVRWTDGSVPGGFFSAQTFRHFSRMLEEFGSADPGQLRYFGGRSLLTQSHGQSLMAYFRSRYAIRGLYLLDEPETALTPARQVEFVRLVRAMAQRGAAQFVIATHSPILLACPGARILNFDAAPIETIAYRQTAHYRLYKAFMDDPEGHFGVDP
ncbi:MAG: AAA family ATPase [Planctomycetes bacterium]|nr:AAA family ATPase [Planctomycetota bacterium]